ncbi:MAG: cellulase family glycosylhydrolase [Burkholderiaceae bacterium]
MATCIALALTTAAITACGGGGSGDATSPTVEPVTTVTGVSDAASAASGEAYTTTNQAAVVAVDTSGSTAPPTDAQAAAPAAPATVSTDTGGNGTVVASAGQTQPVAPQAVTQAVMARPAGNTGKGFFVSGSKLYDPNGLEFRIRGVNRNHWDSYGTPAGLPLSGANTERVVLSFSKATSYNWNIVSSEMLANKIVPIPGNWTGTCKADPASLTAIVDTWVAQASTWTQLNSTGLINIANEWGPANSTVWRDSYITAIHRMRAAGYTGTLVVDSGGCGQDSQDIIKYGAAVLAADPQKNILFDVHVYGGFHFPATASWMQDYTTALSQLKATGLPLIIGEFGPGKNIGPSPTMVTPQKIIADAEANGWGWMPWSWDDNNLQSCASDDNGFSMTTKCGTYRTDSDLTAFGKTVVPILKSTAVKATNF